MEVLLAALFALFGKYAAVQDCMLGPWQTGATVQTVDILSDAVFDDIEGGELGNGCSLWKGHGACGYVRDTGIESNCVI